MEIFFEALLSPNISAQVKRHLYLVFESLITHYQSNEASQDRVEGFYTQLFSQIHSILNRSSGERPVDVTKGALMVLQAALTTIRDSKFLLKIFNGLA